jgi:regulator of protease activity HflC (stomatin/prohibitin superfamily)
VTLEVPTQAVITSDNVSVKVNAVAYFRVLNAIKAIVEVENFLLCDISVGSDYLAFGVGRGRPG